MCALFDSKVDEDVASDPRKLPVPEMNCQPSPDRELADSCLWRFETGPVPVSLGPVIGKGGVLEGFVNRIGDGIVRSCVIQA